MAEFIVAVGLVLVIEGLLERGVGNVVGINDAWQVPVLYAAEEGGPLVSGEQTLADAIHGAGQPWLEGLGSVYKEFIGYLGDTDDGRWFHTWVIPADIFNNAAITRGTCVSNDHAIARGFLHPRTF